jgi:hypothetical protein
LLAMSVPDCARLMDVTPEYAAGYILGAPPSEVLTVEQVDGGYLVETHDHYLTLIHDDGTKTYGWKRTEMGLPEDESDDVEPEYDLGEDADVYADLDAGANLDGVPDGTAQDVMEWVYAKPDDADIEQRAQLALEAEQRSGAPRKTLIATLQRIVPKED